MKKPEQGSLWIDISTGEIYLLGICNWDAKRAEGKRDRYVAIGIVHANRWRKPTGDIAKAVRGLMRVKGALEFKEVKP